MSTERETTKPNTQAPHGTYEFLEQIGDYIFRDRIKDIRVWVIKETVCAETGGSCMDLTIRERTDREITDVEGTQDRHAHITQDGTISRLESHLWDVNKTTVFEEGPTPDIENMLSTVKNLLSRKDVDKYPWVS